MEFRVLEGRRVVARGVGRLVNISRGGLLLESMGVLPLKNRIEIDVDWPSEGVRMALHVTGETLRRQGARTAVKTARSRFVVKEPVDPPHNSALRS